MVKRMKVRSEKLLMVHNSLARCIIENIPKSIYCERLLFNAICNAHVRDGKVTESVFFMKDIFSGHVPKDSEVCDVRDICDRLGDCRIKEEQNDGTWRMTLLFSFFEIDPECKKITVKMNGDVEKYVSALKGQFSKIPLGVFCTLRSMYSQRLYRLLKSLVGFGVAKYGLDKLSELLVIPEYARTGKVMSKEILKPAIAEINKNTDIRVTLVPIKKGKRITAYCFSIWDKEELDRRQKQDKERRKKHAMLDEKIKNDTDPVPVMFNYDAIGL